MKHVHLTIQRAQPVPTELEDPVFDEVVDVAEIYRLLLAMLACGPATCIFFEEIHLKGAVIKLKYYAQLAVPVTDKPVLAERPQCFLYTFRSAGPGEIEATFSEVAQMIVMIAEKRMDRCSDQVKMAMRPRASATV